MKLRFSIFDFRPATRRPPADAAARPAAPSAESRFRNRASKTQAFTLLEILLSMALVGLVLVSLNTFVFSMGELWGRNSDLRLFEQHVRAVTRFVDAELRSAALPPAGEVDTPAITIEEIRTRTGGTENLLTFELPEGCRLFQWPERPLPEVVCSLQVREREGLLMLWHSRLEKRFSDDAPREVVVTPLASEMSYDYFDPSFKNWKHEPQLRRDSQNRLEVPQRIRLKFTYGKLTREAVIAVPAATQALPNF